MIRTGLSGAEYEELNVDVVDKDDVLALMALLLNIFTPEIE